MMPRTEDDTRDRYPIVPNHLLYTLLHMDAGLDSMEGSHSTYWSRNTVPRTYSMMALAL